MTEQIIKALIDWNPWIRGEFPVSLSGIERDYNILSYLKIPEIKIIEGARRVGKSTLLYQVIEKVLKQSKAVLYINFDDPLLNTHALSTIIYRYLETAEIDYLFIDEIQNCPDWVPFIRKLYDQKEIKQIWISGSNSSLIKQEYASLLTGRTIDIHISPLSFKEYLRFKHFTNSKLPLSSREESAVKAAFRTYLKLGGFPAVALREVHQKELLLNYFEDFIYKDIASRYELNSSKIKELGIYLASNSAKRFSYRKIAAALGLHPNTVIDYCHYLQEIFLFEELYKFDYSLKKQLSHEKKMFSIDTGLASAVSFQFSEDLGHLLENLVYNHLKQREQKVFFHKEKKECDFVIQKDLKIQSAIQVSATLSDPITYKREIAGLTEALRLYGLKEGLILTLDEKAKKEISFEGEQYTVTILPIWEWLLISQEEIG